MLYARPLSHTDSHLFAELRASDRPDDVVRAEIVDPYSVCLDCTFEVEKVAYTATARVHSNVETKVADDYNRPMVRRVVPVASLRDKGKSLDAQALAVWGQMVDELKDEAAALLKREGYLAKAQPIRDLVMADLANHVAKLKTAVRRIKEKAAETSWFEVGSESTASWGNMDLAAAKEQAIIAAKVETYDACYGPWVYALGVANDLLKGAEFRPSLYV